MRPDWFDAARCRGMDPALFFPDRGENPMEALKVCAECTVTEECLAYARAEKIKDGIWGGRTGRGRRTTNLLRTCDECGFVFPRIITGGSPRRYCSKTCRDKGRYRTRFGAA